MPDAPTPFNRNSVGHQDTLIFCGASTKTNGALAAGSESILRWTNPKANWQTRQAAILSPVLKLCSSSSPPLAHSQLLRDRHDMDLSDKFWCASNNLSQRWGQLKSAGTLVWNCRSKKMRGRYHTAGVHTKNVALRASWVKKSISRTGCEKQRQLNIDRSTVSPTTAP